MVVFYILLTPAPQAAASPNLSDSEVSFCGVYWTKFECTSDKIRRILTTNRTRGARSGSKPLRTPRLRGEANQCASDTLADSRVQKPKNFLAFFSRLLPHPSTAKRKKKWKGNFLVLLRRFRLQNEHCYYSICGSLELFISPSSRRPRRVP